MTQKVENYAREAARLGCAVLRELVGRFGRESKPTICVEPNGGGFVFTWTFDRGRNRVQITTNVSLAAVVAAHSSAGVAATTVGEIVGRLVDAKKTNGGSKR